MHKSIKKRIMTFSVDFNSKDLDISFYVFKPTVVIVDHLVHGLQHFSLLAQNLGCVQSSIFRSIHGNMVTSSFLFLILNFSSSFLITSLKLSVISSLCPSFSSGIYMLEIVMINL